MTKQSKALCALFITLAAGQMATASPVSPEAALNRALKSERHLAPALTAGRYTLAATEDSEVYVFTRSNGGYLILPADDAAPAVLGYSDSGSFDAATMPPAMKWWLGEYARQIREGGNTGMSPAKAPARDAIAPMVTTKWNQDAPYNDMCPLVRGQRSVTGCAATALAQIMKYHNWPPQGKGSHSYKLGTSTVSLDFSQVNFDWSNMCDTYSSSSTAAQNEAVAELMYACGVSIDMQYSSTASGASVLDVPAAMVEYFDYDAGVRYYSRDYYGINDWNELVYSQLAEYGPVQYSGQSNEGGHSFVCDGYNPDGYFHINWGWGGISDGYFLLTALDPTVQGIGGSSSGFNFSQSIIGCVRKPVSGSTMYLNYLMEGAFTIQESEATLGNTVMVKGATYNFSTGKASGTLGLKVVNNGTNAVQYLPGPTITNRAPLSGISGYAVKLPTDLAAGTYTVTPAIMNTSGTWQDIPVRIQVSQYATMQVTGNTAYFTAGTTPSITVSDFTVESELYIQQLFKLGGTIVNTGDTEYYSTIAAGLMNTNGTLVALGDIYSVDLEAGESMALDYTGFFVAAGSANLTAGNYTLYMLDTDSGKPVSKGISVRLNAAVAAQVTASSFGVAGDASAVNPDDVRFEGTLRCISGYYGGPLYIAIFPYSTSGVSSIDELTTEPVFVSAGNSVSFKASGRLSTVEAGKRYMAVVYDFYNNQVSSVVVFTIDKNAGVGSVEAVGATPTVYPTLTDGPVYIKGDDVKQVKVYSISGALLESSEGRDYIDLSGYAPGMYLIEIEYGADSTERIVNRVIRR